MGDEAAEVDLKELRTLLTSAARGRGAASAAVIERAGAERRAAWTPECDEEPAFLVYSITKTFTAAVILALCDAGQIGLDDRLARWFPGIARAEAISLGNLLNHTGGIPDYGGLRGYHDAVKAHSSAPWPFERFAAETFDKGLRFEPGQGWGYSNPGYMLLKRIAEEVTGRAYRDLVGERVSEPLGLARTFVAESIEDLGSLAPGASAALSADGPPRDVRAHYHPGWVSHGVIASTASDVVRFFDGLFGGELLSPASLGRMTELVAVPMSSVPSSGADAKPRYGKPGYGLGLMGDTASRWGLVLGHNGGGPGYSASVFHAVELGGASVCALGAIEQDFSAEDVVFDVLDLLAAGAGHGAGHGAGAQVSTSTRSRQRTPSSPSPAPP